MINYHNKHFKAIANNSTGEVSQETTFHYRQQESVIWATYSGGSIIMGTITGIVHDDGSIQFAYQHVNEQGQIMTGKCHSVPELLPSGKLRLHESWQWTVGKQEKGTSIIEEI